MGYPSRHTKISIYNTQRKLRKESRQEQEELPWLLAFGLVIGAGWLIVGIYKACEWLIRTLYNACKKKKYNASRVRRFLRNSGGVTKKQTETLFILTVVLLGIVRYV